MITGVSTGGSGLLQGIARLDEVAGRTARSDSGRPDGAGFDPAAEAVSLVEARVDVAANAAVIRATDELHRRWLDVRV